LNAIYGDGGRAKEQLAMSDDLLLRSLCAIATVLNSPISYFFDGGKETADRT
jgi:hypothetical protein